MFEKIKEGAHHDCVRMVSKFLWNFGSPDHQLLTDLKLMVGLVMRVIYGGKVVTFGMHFLKKTNIQSHRAYKHAIQWQI